MEHRKKRNNVIQSKRP